MVSSYSKELRKIGVDAIDIVTNAQFLQATWAKENNIDSDSINFHELIRQQIKFYKPTILWLDDARLFNKKWILSVRNENPSIKLIVGHICAPYNSIISDSFPSFDTMFTCIPCMQKEIQELGVETHLLYHAFDHSILHQINKQKLIKNVDLVFTGSLYTGYGFHKTRIEYLEKMIENNINISIYGNLESHSKVLLKQSMYYFIRLLKNLQLNSLIDNVSLFKKFKDYDKEEINYYSNKLIQSTHQPVFGLEMFKLLSSAKVCFNIHGEIANKCAGNVRLFESTGVGTCLITDWKENLKDLFEVDKEVVAYKSKDECIDKIKWLLNNPQEAEKIGLAGQQRTLKEHTIEKRALHLKKIFQSKLN